MGSTLEHGIYLPSEGEKNCYQGLASNWNKVDGALGDVAGLKQLIESKFTKEIVTELPTEDINPYCIYMILKTDPETNNIYDEWVYINNAWEYLGNTQVDMTQYYTKQEVNELPAVASGVTSTKVGNYDTHLADSNIHVTASDKSKWDTVALIKQLRLVNAQVGSATTIAFANIDDTNGIKVGDKCMDLDAKMFEITAVDTTNQTVTVGSALIDLALDANVVHTSGNETISGAKTFSDNLTIYNSDDTQTPKGLAIRNAQWGMGESGGITASSINFLDKNSAVPASIIASKGSSGQSFLRFSVRTKDSQNNTYAEEIYYNVDTSGNVEFRSWHDNIISLGTSVYKWKDVQTNKINGLTPSSLSMPSDRSARVDISGYFTNTANGGINQYTAVANGFIYLNVSDVVTIHMMSLGSNTLSNYADTKGRNSTGLLYGLFPVRKDDIFTCEWYTTATNVTLNNAYFIPCQGNI